MFTLLHSSMNQELFKKYIWNQSSHYEKYDGALYPRNWSIHCPSLSAMFNSLQSSMNQELVEKHLCNQGSHYEK